MKHKKYPPKFFRELFKTTLADQYDPAVKKNGWERKYALMTEHSQAGHIPEDIVREELVKAPVLHRGGHATPVTDFQEEFGAWGYASAQFIYNRSGISSTNLCTTQLVQDWISATCSLMSSNLEILRDALIESAEGRGHSITHEDINSMLLRGGAIGVLHTLWNAFNRPSYVLAPDLAEMLKHTKLDQFPVEGMRLPYPALVLAPPDSVMIELMGSPGCFIVHEVINEANEHLCWTIHFVDEVFGGLPLGRFDMGAPGQTIVETVERAHAETAEVWEEYQKEVAAGAKHIVANFSGPLPRETLKDALLFVCAAMIYATMPDADTLLASDSPIYKAWIESLSQHRYTARERKEHAQIQAIGNTRRFYLGRQVRIIDRHHPEDDEKAESTTKRASPRLHWRSGHFRRSWHGSAENKYAVTNWIRPTLVGLPIPGNNLERRAGMR